MRLSTAFVLACLAAPTAAAEQEAAAAYVPKAVFCADGSDAICGVVPSFIGPDPMLDASLGYAGLSNDVTSAGQDVQTPFDNMAWQLFVALNWQRNYNGSNPKAGLSGAGIAIWQTWSHPEDVFGGAIDSCENPQGLPRFDLIAKSGAQSRDEGFMQATGQPLIDVNGNFTLYERRLNDVEKGYILAHGLDSLAGQQAFAQAGKPVAFPAGQTDSTHGMLGAIEIKAAWRIVGEAEQAKYFTTRALLDVEGAYVADGKPLCEEVTLGLVGLHLIQKNAAQGNLRPQFIWASFEHEDNAPTAEKACDATDPDDCYKSIAGNACPAPADVEPRFAYYQPACAAAGTNVPPALKPGQETYVWQRTPPYAGGYTTKQGEAACGTQATKCWQVYGLTQQLNTAWRAQLAVLGSPFKNYYLVGTNWGGNVEPDGTSLANGAVPAFMANSTMETYIQSDPKVGNCVGCHANATLAYRKPGPDPQHPVTYPSDFSFLLGLATRQCTDLPAGPIWNGKAAAAACAKTCGGSGLAWNGQWTTTVPGEMSVCGCCVDGVVAQRKSN
jgi:hypothetical protein